MGGAKPFQQNQTPKVYWIHRSQYHWISNIHDILKYCSKYKLDSGLSHLFTGFWKTHKMQTGLMARTRIAQSLVLAAVLNLNWEIYRCTSQSMREWLCCPHAGCNILDRYKVVPVAALAPASATSTTRKRHHARSWAARMPRKHMHGTRVLNLVLEYGTSTRHACMHARSRVTSESILCF
jgi:hypothetical protein